MCICAYMYTYIHVYVSTYICPYVHKGEYYMHKCVLLTLTIVVYSHAALYSIYSNYLHHSAIILLRIVAHLCPYTTQAMNPTNRYELINFRIHKDLLNFANFLVQFMMPLFPYTTQATNPTNRYEFIHFRIHVDS